MPRQPSKATVIKANEFARKMLRQLPGWRTVPPSTGDVAKATTWLLAFRQATQPKRKRRTP